MKICNKCGKQVPDGMLFCQGCGTRMDMPTPTPTPTPVNKQNYGAWGLGISIICCIIAFNTASESMMHMADFGLLVGCLITCKSKKYPFIIPSVILTLLSFSYYI